MKSVAIIGAGPGGLVAAKTLLRCKDSPFEITIFEKADKLGGIWNLQRHTNGENGFLSPETPTNLSRFTCGFSDLSWDSVKLDLGAYGAQRKHDYSRVPMFPKAWMAGQYLELYADKYDICDKIEFQTEVIAAERFKEDESWKWKIIYQKAGAPSSTTHIFDYVVVATGFFSLPRALPQSLAPSRIPSGVKLIHSSKYRNLDDLLPEDHSPSSGKKILMIGGGNSAGEVAGTVAQHISSALHSPTSCRGDLEHIEIIHVTPRPLYGLPPFVPAGPGTPGFIPLDLRLYDFTSRPGKIESYGGKTPDDFIGLVHGVIRSMIGSDQSDLGAPALVSKEDGGKLTDTAYVAISENYSEFVRSGLIRPVSGRVIELKPDDDDAHDGLVARVKSKDGTEQTLEGIAAVINASGYVPSPALDWLPQEVLRDLEYDASAPRLPLILDMLQTYNTSVPDIGFIGFYEGPYWGVMEMQARLLTELWASSAKGVPFKAKDRAFEQKDMLRNLRADMAAKDRGVGQYWFNDYLGYLEETAVDLGLQRNDHPFKEHQGPTSPARYISSDTALPEAGRIVTDLQRTMIASKNGAFVARATFRALQGQWKLERKIVSASSTLPSGTFTGIARLEPREPTSHRNGTDSNAGFDREYVYSEQGTFTPDSGGSMHASRHYVYRYREVDDGLSVWFVKPNDSKTVDYLYHDIIFTDIKTVEGEGSRQVATGHAEHLCEADLYKTDYEFNFHGVSVETWRCKHTVKGPAKDYTSGAVYER